MALTAGRASGITLQQTTTAVAIGDTWETAFSSASDGQKARAISFTAVGGPCAVRVTGGIHDKAGTSTLATYLVAAGETIQFGNSQARGSGGISKLEVSGVEATCKWTVIIP